MKLAASLLLLAISLVAAELVDLHDYTVLKYDITNEDQMKVIYDLGVDVWSRDSVLAIGMNDIMVSSAQKRLLASHGIHHKGVMVADVEELLNAERIILKRLHAQPNADWFGSYHTYEQITSYYQNLTTFYSSISKWVPSIGSSIQGRAIPALTVGNGDKKIFFQGGQHAREWIGPATVAYITTQLLTDPLVKDLLSQITFVIIPLVNVDGYVYTWGTGSNVRLWRKNRRLNSGTIYGVDLNRNWDDHWGGEGSSSNPSSDTYHGTAPFSEPETKAASAFYKDNGPYAGAIDYHSYSQLVLRPYGWTTALPPNEATSKLVGDGIRDEIRAIHNVQYTSEPSWQLYYTAGTASDWFYNPQQGNTLLAYTIELRDTGTYGFVLPPAQIIPTGQENWAAFKYFANYILKTT